MTACVVCGDPATSGLNLDALPVDDAATCRGCAADRKARREETT